MSFLESLSCREMWTCIHFRQWFQCLRKGVQRYKGEKIKEKKEIEGEKEIQRREKEREGDPGKVAIFNPIKVTFLTKNDRDQIIWFNILWSRKQCFLYAGDLQFRLIPLKEDSTYFIIVTKFSKSSKMVIIKEMNFVLL